VVRLSGAPTALQNRAFVLVEFGGVPIEALGLSNASSGNSVQPSPTALRVGIIGAGFDEFWLASAPRRHTQTART
jgi:hypothetical protein